MNTLLNWDNTITVGDYVFHKYKGYDRIYRVVAITKRFLTADDLMYATYASHPWYGAQVGDEYAPEVHIQLAETLAYREPKDTKKLRKIGHHIDGEYLVKVSPTTLSDHTNRLHIILLDLFPYSLLLGEA